MKLILRAYALRFLDLFASEIHDCITAKRLGRGLVLAWGGRVLLIGYEGIPLAPKFLPQKRLTYWKQELGFTELEAPDFTRLLPSEEGQGEKVMNLLLTHMVGEKLERLLEYWKLVCSVENLWIAFGGTREDFETLDYPRKIFIDDPKLRTRDHQREKQSYTRILKAMAPVVRQEQPDYVYFCEYDQLPLIPDLNERQVGKIREEGADLMAHYVDRIDETCNAHLLLHEADPQFYPFWESLSVRPDPKIILTMFGSGSFWTREAFLAVAAQEQTIECYLELYLPTVAHHLGFRVRGWNEEQHLISNLPSPTITQEEARKRHSWTVHPVKEL